MHWLRVAPKSQLSARAQENAFIKQHKRSSLSTNQPIVFPLFDFAGEHLEPSCWYPFPGKADRFAAKANSRRRPHKSSWLLRSLNRLMSSRSRFGTRGRVTPKSTFATDHPSRNLNHLSLAPTSCRISWSGSVAAPIVSSKSNRPENCNALMLAGNCSSPSSSQRRMLGPFTWLQNRRSSPARSYGMCDCLIAFVGQWRRHRPLAPSKN